MCARVFVWLRACVEGQLAEACFSLSTKGSWDWTQLLRLASVIYWAILAASPPTLTFPLVGVWFAHFRLIPARKLAVSWHSLTYPVSDNVHIVFKSTTQTGGHPDSGEGLGRKAMHCGLNMTCPLSCKQHSEVGLWGVVGSWGCCLHQQIQVDFIIW